MLHSLGSWHRPYYQMRKVKESTLYLGVGELEACHREDDLSCSHEEILNDLPGHVHRVRLHVHHCLDVLWALEHTERYACLSCFQQTLKPWCDSGWIYMLPFLQMWKWMGWSMYKSCQSPAPECRRSFLYYPWSWTQLCHIKENHQSKQYSIV